MKPTFTRDNRILAALGLALGAALTGLYALVQRARALSPAAATSRVLLFFLFYIVVLLILALLFVLVRSGVRLLLESRRGVFGTRFRVRVVATHVGLALLPIALLILPTSRLLVKSVEQWFAPPVAETVRSGRVVAEMVRQKNAALEARTAERLRGALASTDAERATAALTRAREESGLDFLEWLPNGGAAVAVSSPRWPVRDVNDPGLEWITDAKARGAARRIEPTPDGGQVGRTLVAVPGGLLVVGTYEPVEEAGPLRALTRATADYAMLQAERASLAAVQVLLFLLLALLVLLAAVWAGLLLARRVTRPIAALAASARRVGAGDFDALVEVEGGDEIAALSGAFNAMTSELKTNRERIVAATAEMAVTNRRLDEERKRVKTILSHLGAGVIAFRDDGTLLFTNDAARDLLGVEEAPSTLDALLSGAPLAPLLSFLAGARTEGPRESTLTLQRPDAARVVEARVVRVPMEDETRASWVATLEDTTALVAAERSAAWEEAARRMAHEIKNPLTPIRLAAERMRRRAASGDDELAAVVDEGASTIIDEVKTLAALVDAFGRFARLPAAALSPTDLGAIVQQVVKLYDGVKTGVTLSADVAGALPRVPADAEQMKRALVNLVDNALSAAPAGGHVVVAAEVEDGHARLTVADDGPGIPAPERARVFEPGFTTKRRGTGLGLAITARIAAEHGGRVTLEENRPRGCRFVLEWPAA